MSNTLLSIDYWMLCFCRHDSSQHPLDQFEPVWSHFQGGGTPRVASLLQGEWETQANNRVDQGAYTKRLQFQSVMSCSVIDNIAGNNIALGRTKPVPMAWRDQIHGFWGWRKPHIFLHPVHRVGKVCLHCEKSERNGKRVYGHWSGRYIVKKKHIFKIVLKLMLQPM